MLNFFKIITINVSVCQCWWRMYGSAVNASTKVALKTYGQKKAHYGDLFPDKLLNKKFKTPDNFYIANQNVANQIGLYLEPFFNESPCTCIIESNPGIALLTRKLLDREKQFKKIILMESMPHFMNNLQELHNIYPERVQVKQCDVANMWKIVYQDKLDNGCRIKELLGDIPCKPFNEEPNTIVFGAIGSYKFYKNLIYNLIYEAGLFAYGRPEMYLIVPPPIYLHMTCSSEFGYLFYRSATILFQILFEYRFIGRLPRQNFLPAQIDKDVNTMRGLQKIRIINPEYLYLVRIIPRQNLHKLCSPEDLPALLYFITQNCMSRYNRIVPHMEKYVPGCGPRLLLPKKTRKSVTLLYSDEDVNNLPLHSTPCTTMSNRDYADINIFTQFGDLTASQMLTLFCQFRRFPEYNESTFMASFENSLLKTETSNTEASLDNILEVQDFMNSTNYIPEQEEEDEIPYQQQKGKSKKCKVKKKNKSIN